MLKSSAKKHRHCQTTCQHDYEAPAVAASLFHVLYNVYVDWLANNAVSQRLHCIGHEQHCQRTDS